MPVWRQLLEQSVRFADSFARRRAGKRMAISSAMTAMTTNNSINVNPVFLFLIFLFPRTVPLNLYHQAVPSQYPKLERLYIYYNYTGGNIRSKLTITQLYFL